MVGATPSFKALRERFTKLMQVQEALGPSNYDSQHPGRVCSLKKTAMRKSTPSLTSSFTNLDNIVQMFDD